MRLTITYFLAIIYLLTANVAWAQDIRAAAIQAEADHQKAKEAAQAAEVKILKDRQALLVEVTRLENRKKQQAQRLDTLRNTLHRLQTIEAALSSEWTDRELQFREVTGTIRVVARELETVMKHSPFTAAEPERMALIQPLTQKDYFPGIDDIGLMVDHAFEEIERSGQISLKRQSFIDRSGVKQQGQVLFLGKFSAVYKLNNETGFLRYSEEEKKLYMVEQPSWRIGRNLKKYLSGREDSVYLDLSKGAVLQQIAHRQSLWEQILSGGPIVWPLMVIALLAAVLVIERIILLNRVRGNTDRLMDKMNMMAAKGDWKGCEGLVKKYEKKDWPVVNVLAAGLAGRHEDRETLENILEEALLREVPRLERYLSILSILGAIAPLLGLLGTVTGMIDTFRVITLYGTGDPKMMSGGISEALITTELGLAIAIPIMLLHTFLSRRVDHVVGDMEEKALALTNILHKQRL